MDKIEGLSQSLNSQEDDESFSRKEEGIFHKLNTH
jgi:hypothetical protein